MIINEKAVCDEGQESKAAGFVAAFGIYDGY
jgi:hypothetical protein